MKQIKNYLWGSMIPVLVLWTLICIAPVSAADNSPCSADIAKYCKNAGSDRTAIMECLEKNEKKLSAACKDYEAKVMEGRKGEKREEVKEKRKFLQSCKADITKLCKDADSKTGGYVKCIKEHKSELSAPCAGWVEAQQEEKAK